MHSKEITKKTERRWRKYTATFICLAAHQPHVEAVQVARPRAGPKSVGISRGAGGHQ